MRHRPAYWAGWAQIALGAIIVATALLVHVLYGRRLGSATTAFAHAAQAFSEQVRISADMVERNRSMSNEMARAVDSYEQLVVQIRDSSRELAGGLPEVERQSRAAVDRGEEIGKAIEAWGDRALWLKYPSDIDVNYTRIWGAPVPTGLSVKKTPVFSETGRLLKESGTDLQKDCELLDKAIGKLFPEVTKLQTRFQSSCEDSIAVLHRVQSLAREVDQKRLPESLHQMRVASEALSGAGGQLSRIEPALWFAIVLIVLIGLLCVTNGLMLLRIRSSIMARSDECERDDSRNGARYPVAAARPRAAP